METVTIELTSHSLQVIAAALQELPYKIARPVIEDIDRQVNEALKKKAPPILTVVPREP